MAAGYISAGTIYDLGKGAARPPDKTISLSGGDSLEGWYLVCSSAVAARIGRRARLGPSHTGLSEQRDVGDLTHF